MVLAGPCICFQIAHASLYPSIRSYFGLLSPSSTLNDVDFIPSTYLDLIAWGEQRGTCSNISEANFSKLSAKYRM